MTVVRTKWRGRVSLGVPRRRPFARFATLAHWDRRVYAARFTVRRHGPRKDGVATWQACEYALLMGEQALRRQIRGANGRTLGEMTLADTVRVIMEAVRMVNPASASAERRTA